MFLKSESDSIKPTTTLAKLTDNPALSEFLAVTGMITPRSNQLASFDQQLQSKLEEKHTGFLKVLSQIEELTQLLEVMEEVNPDSNPAVRMLKDDLYQKNKVLEIAQQPVEYLLKTMFKEMIVAVIQEYSDEMLVKFSIDKKIIIDSLYRNFAHYLDVYRIDRKAIFRLESMVKFSVKDRQAEIESLIRPSNDLVEGVKESDRPKPVEVEQNELARKRRITLAYGERKKPSSRPPTAAEIRGKTMRPGADMFRSPEVEQKYRSYFEKLLAETGSSDSNLEQNKERGALSLQEMVDQVIAQNYANDNEQVADSGSAAVPNDSAFPELPKDDDGLPTTDQLVEALLRDDNYTDDVAAHANDNSDTDADLEDQAPAAEDAPKPYPFLFPNYASTGPAIKFAEESIEDTGPKTPRSFFTISETLAEADQKVDWPPEIIAASRAATGKSSNAFSEATTISYACRISAINRGLGAALPELINPDPEPKAQPSKKEAVTVLMPANPKTEKPLPTPKVIPAAKVISLPAFKKPNWRESLSATISERFSWLKKQYYKNRNRLALAAGLAVAGTGAYYLAQNSGQQSADSSVAGIATGIQTANPTPTQAPTETVAAAPATPPAADQKEQVLEIDGKTSQYSSIIKNSKSKFVQEMVHEGKYTLGHLSILDSMIAPFKGLANGQQKVKIAELEKEIQVGLVIYFYEKFGDETKKAESFKDPKLRNLWQTAKGVKLSDLSKQLSPKAYQEARNLAVQILETDAAELGLDTSINPKTAGNIFQSHSPKSKIGIRKADGSLHVVMERLDQIFEGALSENMAKKFSGEKANEAGHEKNDADVRASDSGGSGTILPNIFPQTGNSLEIEQQPVQPVQPAKPAGTGPQGFVPKNLDGEIFIEPIRPAESKEARVERERREFLDSGKIELQLDKRLTRGEERKVVIDEMCTKLTGLLGTPVQRKLVERTVRQFGYIGFTKMEISEKGAVRAVLHERVQAILLQSLKIKNS